MSSLAEDQDVLRLEGIEKSFQMGAEELHILRGISLAIKRGEFVGLLGPSGAGKSTLLHIAGLLERTDAGEVFVVGESCGSLSDIERTVMRRHTIGFVYQFHNLLPEFTALDNAALPLMIAGVSKSKARERAKDLLSRLGLADRTSHQPNQLSGGEQQRVAIARALANRPRLLLADEPTGNLDEQTSAQVFEELIRVARDEGVGALVATHNVALGNKMDRRIQLHNGKIEE